MRMMHRGYLPDFEDGFVKGPITLQFAIAGILGGGSGIRLF